ncbi:MAG: UDP-N-acetylmuramate--L-alanine ligase [Microbacteriaceae bacterium]|nr:UDP-N-acetylmuramate--L-alanine ligase [Microbacteriaceae bacterium]
MIRPNPNTQIPESIEMPYFAGIGGTGMSAIASVFLDQGFRVFGSDPKASPTVDLLISRGAKVTTSQIDPLPEGIDAFIFTGALKEDNPQYLEAQRLGIPVLHRSQALAYLARGKRIIAVAGAHGKTTTTGMIATALSKMGADPSFVNGSPISALGTAAKIGKSDLFVIEADESDGSFLLYDTEVAVITNVDPDHLDFWETEERYVAAFAEFAEKATGAVVRWNGIEGVRRGITYGLEEDSNVMLNLSEVSPRVKGTVDIAGVTVPLELAVAGKHNALNATAAMATLVGLGFNPVRASEALAQFTGTSRRFELLGTPQGVAVYDDYAHHPTEVHATLAMAKSLNTTGRVIAVHQPHQFSRTQLRADEFAGIFEEFADFTVVLDIYAAREEPIPGVTGQFIVDKFSNQSKAKHIGGFAEATDFLASFAQPGDSVIFLSGGDAYIAANLLVQKLEAR